MGDHAIGRPAEILLVEDNLGDARLTSEALAEGRIPHRLSILFDGQEASEFLHRRGVFARAPRPDLILLDLSLPKMDGRDLLAVIRDDAELAAIPVIVLTSSAAHEDFLRAEELQVDAYLTKPVDLDRFLTVVRQMKRVWLENLLQPVSG
ncbi:MAG: response regulator [Pirellulales bacterium]